MALVELSANETELALMYHRHPDWELAGIYSESDALWSVRLAHSLGVPLILSLEDLANLECSRIVVGSNAGGLRERLAGIVDPEMTEICSHGPSIKAVRSVTGFQEHFPGPRLHPGATNSPGIAPPDPIPIQPIRPVDAATENAPAAEPVVTDEADRPVGPDPIIRQFRPPLSAGREDRGTSHQKPSGEDIDQWLDPEKLSFDPSRGDLVGFLALTCRRLKASSASLAVLDGNRSGVRLVAWHGLSPEVAANPRKSLDCAAGRALLGAGPQIAHSSPVPSAEDDTLPVEMTYCSFPVSSRGKLLAVLNLSVSRRLEIDSQSFPQDIRDVLSETEFHLLKSVETGSLDWPDRRQLLLHGVDRAMSLDESLPDRLRAAGELLTLHLSAATSHIYLSDLTGDKLQLISPETGFGSLGARYQDLNGGLLGWAARFGGATCLFPHGEDPGDGSDRQGLCILPLANERRIVGVIVVECVPVPPGKEDTLSTLMMETSHLMNEMLSVEQGLGDQDIFGQIRMRITEIVHSLGMMEPLSRVQAILDAAMEVLAAEAVIWISPAFQTPVIPRNLSSPMLDCLARFWPEMSRVTTHIRENGRSCHLPDDPSPDFQPVLHYAGVAQQDCDGVLVALFGDSVNVGPQLTTSTILEVLHSISEHVEKGGTSGLAAGEGTGGSVRILSLGEIQKRIIDEWFRSLRFGHGFSVSRIRLSSDTESEEEHARLRDFMRRVNRSVDSLCELPAGGFCLLSVETDRFPDGVQTKLQSLWRNEGADARLEIEQMMYPQDGQSRKAFLDFAAGIDAAA